MSDKFSFYQTEGLWGIIENASDEKQTSIKSYFGSDLIIKRLNEQAEQIDQLKQQLAEKDKEIAHLKEMDNYHLLYELAGADETIANLKKQLEEKDKDKTQLAIQELEKAKDNLYELYNEPNNNGRGNFWNSIDVIDIIDQQIKELKGE